LAAKTTFSERRNPFGSCRSSPQVHTPRESEKGGGGTMTAVCRCRKTCKNSHGPKIHQARIKCLENEHVPQRTDVTSDEMQEELNQEAPHSSQSLCVPLTIPPSLLPQPKVQRSLQPPIP